MTQNVIIGFNWLCPFLKQTVRDMGCASVWCSSRLQHLQQGGQLQSGKTVEELLRAAVPRPDKTLAFKARVELTKAARISMAAQAQHVLSATNKKVFMT